MIGVATLLNPSLAGWKSDARLFRVEPPLAGYGHVIVSAATVYGWPEVMIFGSNAAGGHPASSGLPLPATLKGTLDHAEALRLAGYEVAQ